MRPKVAPTWSAAPADAGAGHQTRATIASAAAARRSRREHRAPQSSKDDGRLMDTEYPAQVVADLAQRHARAHRRQDGREQVVSAPGRAFHGLQGPLDGVTVPRLLQPLQALRQGAGQMRIDVEEITGRAL